VQFALVGCNDRVFALLIRFPRVLSLLDGFLLLLLGLLLNFLELFSLSLHFFLLCLVLRIHLFLDVGSLSLLDGLITSGQLLDLLLRCTIFDGLLKILLAQACCLRAFLQFRDSLDWLFFHFVLVSGLALSQDVLVFFEGRKQLLLSLLGLQLEVRPDLA